VAVRAAGRRGAARVSKQPRPQRQRARAAARPAPARGLEHALARARDHARTAAAEAALAARALLDAASLGASGVPAEGHAALRSLLRWLEEAAAGAGGGAAARWAAALADALDAEIARWEARSRSDPEARGVLRAFLGLRELLWELGVQRPAPDVAAPPPRPPAPRAARRLERVAVEPEPGGRGRADRPEPIR